MITDEPRRHSLSMMLRRSAQRHAQKTALTCGDVQWSYDDLDRIVDRLACGLKKSGYGKDDRIAVLARNSHAFIAARFAVARIGAVFVPINFMLLPEEVRYIITAEPSAQNVIPLLARHRATSFFAPPTIWISLLRSPLFDVHDLSSLIQGDYGASIMPVEVLRELQQRLPGLRLWNLYGQTEIAPVATILFPEEHAHRLGSAGRPTLHVQTRVVDEAMVDVAVGQIGEIVHRSPQLFSGYWHDQERTAEAFAGGWFHSGDLGVVDADGYITVVDRKKDMSKTGGENVSSREVEEIIYGHPAVSETAVIGVPDPKWIEVVTAVVVKRPGAHCSEAAIIEHCSNHLARFKTPKRVVFVATLPRNASGKILKRELRRSIRSDAPVTQDGAWQRSS